MTPDDDARAAHAIAVAAIVAEALEQGGELAADPGVARQPSPELSWVLKVADLIANISACADAVARLGERWTRRIFRPLALEVSTRTLAVAVPGLPRTAALLRDRLARALHRLETTPSGAPTATRPASADHRTWDGSPGTAADHDAALAVIEEREWREGALVRGAHLLPPEP